MKITLDNSNAGNRITSYQSGSIHINGEMINHSVIICPDKINPWQAVDMDSLTEDHFREPLKHKPEILLLGTGATQCFPTQAVWRLIAEAGVGFEIMDTAAACRTYNVLISEDRNVVAALLMID